MKLKPGLVPSEVSTRTYRFECNTLTHRVTQKHGQDLWEHLRWSTLQNYFSRRLCHSSQILTSSITITFAMSTLNIIRVILVHNYFEAFGKNHCVKYVQIRSVFWSVLGQFLRIKYYPKRAFHYHKGVSNLKTPTLFMKLK